MRWKLALHGGPKAVTAPGPESYLHGPQEIGEEEIEEVTRALRTKNLFRFLKEENLSATARFEKAFAAKTGASHMLAVNSGTSALIAALVGLEVSSGDEVLVPAYTYIATASAVLAVRAIPVIVEVDRSLNMDPVDLERKITPRSRAIIAVHMRGVAARLDEILGVARRHQLRVLEDCAQACGGVYKGRFLGTIGDAGAFSFQQYKVITAGEGGGVVTDDPLVYERAACYHDSACFFWMKRDWRIRPFVGENYRMSDLNGAVALAQLAKMDRILARLRQIKRRLTEVAQRLPEIELQDVPDPDGDCGVMLIFFTRDQQSARFWSEALRAEGMSAGTIFDKTIPDRHIFYHWDYVMEKNTPDRHGYPWRDPSRPAQVTYSRDMCPRTIALLHRAVALRLTQRMSDEFVAQCEVALQKVSDAIQAGAASGSGLNRPGLEGA